MYFSLSEINKTGYDCSDSLFLQRLRMSSILRVSHAEISSYISRQGLSKAQGNKYEGFCLHTHFCRTKYTFSRNLFTVCAGTDWAADSRDKNKTDPSLRLPAVPAPSVAVCLFNTGRGPMVNNTRPGGTDPTKRWSGHWTDFLLTVVIVIKAFYDRALITKSWIMWRGWCF